MRRKLRGESGEWEWGTAACGREEREEWRAGERKKKGGAERRGRARHRKRGDDGNIERTEADGKGGEMRGKRLGRKGGCRKAPGMKGAGRKKLPQARGTEESPRVYTEGNIAVLCSASSRQQRGIRARSNNLFPILALIMLCSSSRSKRVRAHGGDQLLNSGPPQLLEVPPADLLSTNRFSVLAGTVLAEENGTLRGAGDTKNI
ncbi:hypothetical protein C8R44DRAFT_740480 [Mycena epipterygia]|nr:hypothetical protein C8R44DRAFT_740480 [Mycena epipterygia]